MQHASGHKLRVPGGLFVILNLLEELSEGLLLLLAFGISYNIDDLERLLGKLGSGWSNVGKLDSERLVSGLLILSLDDLYLNDLGCLALDEGEGTLDSDIVDSISSSMAGLIELDCLVVHLHLSI